MVDSIGINGSVSCFKSIDDYDDFERQLEFTVTLLSKYDENYTDYYLKNHRLIYESCSDSFHKQNDFYTWELKTLENTISNIELGLTFIYGDLHTVSLYQVKHPSNSFDSLRNINLKRLVKIYYKLIEIRILLKSLIIESAPEDVVSTKYAAKFYALYHWILIELGKVNIFNKDNNDNYPKKIIIDYAKEKYPSSSSQQFYNSFRDLDITNKTAIANSFGKGYKDIIIEISNNDSNVITYLKSFPN